VELKIIELSEEEAGYIKQFVNESDTSQVAFLKASELCKHAHEKLWNALGKLHPDAMSKGTTFNHEKGTIQYIED